MGTIWSRLEPSARAEFVTSDGTIQPDLEPGLQARIADPLWMLARQWQLGEFRGEDAASPVRVRAAVKTARPARFVGNGSSRALPGRGVLLEPHVEAEPLANSGGRFGRNAEAGLHLLRLLDAEGVGALRPKFRAKYPLSAPAMGALVDGETRRRVAILRRTSLDAAGFAAAYDSAAPGALPSGITAVQMPKVMAAVDTWRAWLAGRFFEPGAAGSTWKSSRLEYGFGLVTADAQGPLALEAKGYPGGHLDWHSFDLVPGPSPIDDDALTSTTIEVLPTSVRFRGMPRHRFWSFEEGTVNFAGIAAGPPEPARLLVAEFATVFGDDWYIMPIPLVANTLARVSKVEVIDTFGKVTTLRSCAENDGVDRTWRFFELTGDDSVDRGHAPWVYVAPAVAGGATGSPVERVLFARDEGANLAWAIESLVEDPLGCPIDRTQAALRSAAPAATSATWSYRAESPTRPNWIPLVPVLKAGNVQYKLRRGRMEQWGTDLTAGARGTLLAGPILDIREEEVPSEGVVVTRAWQLARNSDGSLLVWLGRHKRAGRGEARSGLRFDRILGTGGER